MVWVSILTTVIGITALGFFRKRQRSRDRRRHLQSRLANQGCNVLCDETGAKIFKILSLGNDVELYCRRWSPQSGVKVTAVLIMVHGLTFHSAYFEEIAKYLTRFGIVVITYDMAGHGKSGCIEGFRCYFDRYDSLLDDLNQITELMIQEHPRVPLFLYGESLGAQVVLQYCQREGVKELLTGGIIVSATPVRIQTKFLPKDITLPAIKALARTFPKTKLIGSGLSQGYEDAFGDPDIARKVADDPLVYKKQFRIRMVMELLKANQRLQENLEELLPPMLILHGDADDRVPMSCSEELMRRAGSIDKSIEVFEDGHHQLLQEEQVSRYRVFQAIDQWLQMHMNLQM